MDTIWVLGFPGGSDGKEAAYNTEDPGLILGLGRSSGEGNGHPFQYSGLENSMDCSPLCSSVHGILQAIILNGLPLASPWDHPDPRIEPGSPALQAASLPSEPPGKPKLKPSRGKRPVQSHMSFTNPDHMFSKVALVSQKDMGPKQDYEA